jgi:hypothetical protein
MPSSKQREPQAGGIRKQNLQPKKRFGYRAISEAQQNDLRCSLKTPLSELHALDFAHIPLGDVETFVNRDPATRQAEVEERKSKPGKILRPLNPYMLYRMRYHAVAAQFCKMFAGNQNGISIICGASWWLEADEVRRTFREWAEVESENHAMAFPDYRFALPSKRRLPEDLVEDLPENHAFPGSRYGFVLSQKPLPSEDLAEDLPKEREEREDLNKNPLAVDPAQVEGFYPPTLSYFGQELPPFQWEGQVSPYQQVDPTLAGPYMLVPNPNYQGPAQLMQPVDCDCRACKVSAEHPNDQGPDQLIQPADDYHYPARNMSAKQVYPDPLRLGAANSATVSSLNSVGLTGCDGIISPFQDFAFDNDYSLGPLLVESSANIEYDDEMIDPELTNASDYLAWVENMESLEVGPNDFDLP